MALLTLPPPRTNSNLWRKLEAVAAARQAQSRREECEQLKVTEAERRLATQAAAAARFSRIVGFARESKQVRLHVMAEAAAHASRILFNRLTVAEIQYTVARHFGVLVGDILSARRYIAIIRPRHVAMYLSKNMTTHSVLELGRRFRRDHSTVLHAVQHISDLIETDIDLAADVNAIHKQLGG